MFSKVSEVWISCLVNSQTVLLNLILSIDLAFDRLTITWKNHMDEHLPEAVIPKDKLKFVSGDIIYNETNVKVREHAAELFSVLNCS